MTSRNRSTQTALMAPRLLERRGAEFKVFSLTPPKPLNFSRCSASRVHAALSPLFPQSKFAEERCRALDAALLELKTKLHYVSPNNPASPALLPPSSPIHNRTTSFLVQPSTPSTAFHRMPSPPAAPVGTQTCTAHIAFVAIKSTQLSFECGETFTIIDSSKTWWTVRNSRGQEGLVPSNYVKVVEKSKVVEKTPDPPPRRNTVSVITRPGVFERTELQVGGCGWEAVVFRSSGASCFSFCSSQWRCRACERSCSGVEPAVQPGVVPRGH